jgi:Icc protein
VDARHVILHLSDTHLVGGGRRLYGDVDSRARLAQILAENLASGRHPDMVILTGDLADAGEADAYRELRAMMRAFEERGSQLVWLMGNHDDGSLFRREILGDTTGAAPLYGVTHRAGLRVVFLDTSVPGFHHGDLGDTQLRWLAGQLRQRAPEGTILAMHHPPLPPTQGLAALTALRHTDALADALRGSDVRLILAGHLHTSTTGMFAGIPVSVGSATSYTQDTNIPDDESRGRDGAQSATLVHVFDDTIVTTVSPIGHYDTVGAYLDADAVSARLRIGVDPVRRRA